MALDLYVGPVSRYVMGDWKNVGQQMAEAQGIEYRVTGPGVRKTKSFFARRRMEKAYQGWQSNLAKCLSWDGPPVATWDDSPTLDYVTDRPGMEGRTGLIVRYASLLRPDLTFPDQLPTWLELLEGDDLREAKSDHLLLRVLSDCWTWLPVRFDELFTWWVPRGKPCTMASVGMLNAALDQVCQLWGKDRAVMNELVTDQPGPNASVDEAALHGLAVYCRLAAEASRRNLPMIVDA